MSAGRLAARVRAGITLLDIERGPEWVWKVRVGFLDMASCSACVLGQLYGDFEQGADTIGLTFWSEVGHGLNAEEDRYGDFAALDRLWTYAIRRLREQRTPPRVSAVAS